MNEQKQDFEIVYFYVVEENYEGSIEQITNGMDSYQKAKEFKEDPYYKKRYPNSFIIAKLKDK